MIVKLIREKAIIGVLFAMFLLTVFGISYATGVDGPIDKSLSLADAVDLAAKNNPDIEIANLTAEKVKVEYNRAKKTAEDIDADYVYTYDLALIKWFTPKSAENNMVLADKSKQIRERETKYSVESAYYNVLKSQQNLTIKRERLKYSQDQLKITQAAYKVGTKAKLDVNTAEAGVASSQAQVTSEENNYRIAVMELNKLMGLDLSTPLNLSAKFIVEKTGSSIKLDEVLDRAREDNIDILTVKSTQELSKLKYDLAKQYYVAGVSIFDTATIDAKIADASVRKQDLATTSLIRENYLTLFTYEKTIDYNIKEVEKAQENARIYLVKYEAGLSTSLDAKNASIDLEQAKETMSETIYKYNLLKSQFKYELFKPISGGGY